MKERAFTVAKQWEISFKGLWRLWKMAELPMPLPNPLSNISAGQVATLREFYARGLMTGFLVGYRTKNGRLRPDSDYEPWELERKHTADFQLIHEAFKDWGQQLQKERAEAEQKRSLNRRFRLTLLRA